MSLAVNCNWLIFDLNHSCRAPVSRTQATKLYVEVLLIVTKAPGRAVATGREVRESGQE